MLVTVLWRDAAIELVDEVTNRTIPGKHDASQILHTVGWLLAIKEGQVILAIDRDPVFEGAEADRPHRWVYRIPASLVLEIRQLSPGRRVSLTGKEASGSTKATRASGPRSSGRSTQTLALSASSSAPSEAESTATPPARPTTAGSQRANTSKRSSPYSSRTSPQKRKRRR